MTTIVDLNDIESKLPLSPNEDSTTRQRQDLGGELDGELNKVASNTLSLKNLSLKQLYIVLWSNVRSWGSFFDSSRMKLPTATMQWSKRFIKNIDYFRSNYIFVFTILLVYCILTSPFLLLLMAASIGACYLVSLKNKESPVKIFGYQLSLTHQYIGVAICSFPFFWLVGAGSAVFWVLGASLFVIGLHASLYAIESIETDENKSNDLFPASVSIYPSAFPSTQTV